MPSDDLTTAHHLLHGLPSVDPKGTCRRLRDALDGVSSHAADWHDIAALVRQILLEQQARGTGDVIPFRVPLRAGLPTVAQWNAAGCESLGQDPSSVTIVTREWLPPSEEGEDLVSVRQEVADVYARRDLRSGIVLADPFWTATLGHETYLSLGQRQAARTVALAPPGTTTFVCLPTGQGKTDVVLASILADTDQPAVSVIVVPTVALAVDMERRVRNIISRMGHRGSPSGQYAYLGGLSADIKNSMRAAIRSGEQKVVFTAPESVFRGGIGHALTDAAHRGHLKYVVIDEAHLVEQWGAEFRPDFQALAGLRAVWNDEVPPGRRPVTVTMSATLTDDQIAYLTRLLPGSETSLVWASALRPEPSYFVRGYPNADERDRAVLEAVCNLPRPLALYATTRKDVDHWVELLNGAGLRRVGRITGDSNDDERRALIEGWSGGGSDQRTRFDVVVGTSAFGLGIDMSDVRSVVHACRPETIDRFYQEVGRAGRDGKASLSFLATAPRDTEIARRLNTKKIIGVDKGWDRWRQMKSRPPVVPRVYRVDLDSRPSHLGEAFGRSRDWNVRLLNLMVRAGLVRLKPAPLPGEEAAKTADVGNGAAQPEYLIDVEVLTSEAMDKGTWSARIEAERKTIHGAEMRAWAAMEAVLSAKDCLGSVLGDHYIARWSGGRLTTAINCRGCPHCRSHRMRSESGMYRRGVDPHPAVHAWCARPVDPLIRARGNSALLVITWRDAQERRDRVSELLERLARRGMTVMGGPECSSEFASRMQREVSPFPLIVDTDGDLLATHAGAIVWMLDAPAEVGPEIRQRTEAGMITYLVHGAPSQPNLDSVKHGYGEIPTLSVATALREI